MAISIPEMNFVQKGIKYKKRTQTLKWKHKLLAKNSPAMFKFLNFF